MKKLKITDAKWVRKDGTVFNSNYDSKKGNIHEIAQCYTGFNMEETKEEAIKNAILIEDARNTYNESGFLPSELWEQKKILSSALKKDIDNSFQAMEISVKTMKLFDEADKCNQEWLKIHSELLKANISIPKLLSDKIMEIAIKTRNIASKKNK
jgi:hypothetical protein